MQHTRYAITLVFIFWTITGTILCAQSPWDKRVSRDVSGAELRDSLDMFTKSQNLCFLLDRRIDPGTILEFRVSNRTTREACALLADSLGLGFCEIGPVAYIGPKDAAAKLNAMRSVQQKYLTASNSSELTKKLSAPISVKTQKLRTPREILTIAAGKSGLTWTNLDAIPHDLWPELDFKDVPAADLFSLLLIGFDKTFKVSSNGMEISVVAFPDQLDQLAQATLKSPKPTQSDTSSKQSNSTQSTSLSKLRFSITIQEQKADEVLKSLADKIGLKLEIDNESLRKKGISLDKTVSFSVQNASVNKLFQTLLQQVGCKHTITGKTIKISAK